MKVTGYQIRHRLNELEQERKIALSHFNDSLKVFEGDAKESPKALMDTYRQCEEQIAQLQVVQAHYNLNVQVDVGDRTMPLCQAVKMVGGAGRAEKLWRTAAMGNEKDRYSYREDSREAGTEYAKRTMPVPECMAESKKASRWASSLRQAMALGNAVEIEIEGMDPDLLRAG